MYLGEGSGVAADVAGLHLSPPALVFDQDAIFACADQQAARYDLVHLLLRFITLKP